VLLVDQASTTCALTSHCRSAQQSKNRSLSRNGVNTLRGQWMAGTGERHRSVTVWLVACLYVPS